MSPHELLHVIPPIARYTRQPLVDRRNALLWWSEAAEVMVQPDDAPLYEELVYGSPETGSLTAFPTGSDADRVRRLLQHNQKTLELLRAGVRCRRLQFPEPEEEGSIAESAESLAPLVHLANTWFMLARSLIAQHDCAAAATELVNLGQMGQMICCGEGLVVHYLVGSSIMAMALAGMRLLVAEEKVPGGVLPRLSAALDRWLAESGNVAQCLRVDLCCHWLGEIDRLSQCDGPEDMVDHLLDRHYANAPMLGEKGDGSLLPERPAGCFAQRSPVPFLPEDEALQHDGRLRWRRERILYLLEGHPAPFDKIATVRLTGRQVADRILDLQPRRRLNLLGLWGRVIRRYRRARFRYRTELWPVQLRASFPYEYLGHSEADEQLQVARRRLRFAPNPLGVLVADALLATDIAPHEHLRRRRLEATRAAVSGQW